MSSTLTLESATEFNTARRKAFITEWLNVFTGRPNELLSFEEVKQNLRLQDSAYKGLQEIELDKIVGSTGRYRDFNRSFLPKNDQTEERWRRVDAVTHEMGGLPPIDVYKVGDAYFVRDGNHRVSVAQLHDAKTIEAYVIEYATPVTIEQFDDLDDILLKSECATFFERTQLDKIRPQQNVEFTEPGRYRLVKAHIAFHKYLKETECSCEIAYEEAVASWYDNVYMPVIKMFRQQNILDDFPDRTEADLYGWLMLHRSKFERETDALGFVPDTAMIEAVKRERATNPFARLMGWFRNRMELKNLPLKVGRAKFLEKTRLNEIRPKHGVHFTEPGCYQLAWQHIEKHKYLKEIETSREFSIEDAVASWYDNVYMPVIKLIREHGVIKQYPQNTEGDLYIWLVSRREAIEDKYQAMGQVPTEDALEALEQELASNSIFGLIQLSGKKLDLQSVLENSV